MSTCITCGKTATRLVEVHVMADDLSPTTVGACAEHAREYSGNTNLHKVLVRLLALTTTAMPAPIRSRHVKIVLADNGITIGEHEMVTRVTAEHVGPTHVHCNMGALARVEEVLRFQNWTVIASPDLPNEWHILHDEPTFVEADIDVAPGITNAVKVVRFDELAKIQKLVEDLGDDEDDLDALRMLGMVLHTLDARRIELDTSGGVYG